jgi:hypothetical protein
MKARSMLAAVGLLVSSVAAGQEHSFDVPLEVELGAFQRHGSALAAQVFGTRDLRDVRVQYQDGVVSLSDGGLAADHARLFLTFDLPAELHVDPAHPLRGSYSIGADGQAHLSYIETIEGSLYARPFAASALFRDGVTPEEMNGLRDQLASRFPELEFQALEAIGAFTLISRHVYDPAFLPSVADFLGAYREVAADARIESVYHDHLAFRIPHEFDPMIEVEPGAVKVDLNALRRVSKRWKSEGWVFRTLPSLPAPFGPGEVLNPEWRGAR